jgi:hypothetical protein
MNMVRLTSLPKPSVHLNSIDINIIKLEYRYNNNVLMLRLFGVVTRADH